MNKLYYTTARAGDGVCFDTGYCSVKIMAHKTHSANLKIRSIKIVNFFQAKLQLKKSLSLNTFQRLSSIPSLPFFRTLGLVLYRLRLKVLYAPCAWLFSEVSLKCCVHVRYNLF